MILVAIGSNLAGAGHASPRAVCEAALGELDAAGLRVVRRSRWYRTAPVPVSDQPWFVNGVASLETGLDPASVLDILHGIEARFGRARRAVNEARVLDLDLLAYGDQVRAERPVLPHPRLHLRAFVLLPLAEVAPGWRHPLDGRTVEAMIASLPPGQQAVPEA